MYVAAAEAIFDAGWQSFVSDPEVPPILKEAGHKGKPQAALWPAASTPEHHPSRGGPAAVGPPRRAAGVLASPAW